MKKLILLLTILSGSGLLIASGRYGQGPETTGGAAQFPEYGGLQYSSSAFSLNGATIAGSIDLLGVYFSSGTTSDFVSVWYATSTTAGVAAAQSQEIWRIFNTVGSTAPIGAGVGQLSGGFVPVFGTSRGSVRIPNNVIWFPSVGTRNLINLIYNKD